MSRYSKIKERLERYFFKDHLHLKIFRRSHCLNSFETLTGFDDQAQLTLNFWFFPPYFQEKDIKKSFKPMYTFFQIKKERKEFPFQS